MIHDPSADPSAEPDAPAPFCPLLIYGFSQFLSCLIQISYLSLPIISEIYNFALLITISRRD